MHLISPQRNTSKNAYLEGDEDDEVSEVEAEHLGAGGGAGHDLQGSGQQGSILCCGQAWERRLL